MKGIRHEDKEWSPAVSNQVQWPVSFHDVIEMGFYSMDFFYAYYTVILCILFDVIAVTI
jgi:hypothetical protein